MNVYAPALTKQGEAMHLTVALMGSVPRKGVSSYEMLTLCGRGCAGMGTLKPGTKMCRSCLKSARLRP